MTPNRAKSQIRRRPLFQIRVEGLESRQLLTGGGGNTIALAKGAIDVAGGTTTAPFTVESGHFTVPRHKLTLGVDVVADSSSTIVPKIASVSQGSAKVATVTLPKNATTTANDPHAVLATVIVPQGKKGFSAKFTTKVAAQNNTSGGFLLGYYLPGDANGDGKVTKDDIASIKKLVGKTVNDSTYAFDADSNRDGRITMSDVNIAKGNLGVTTSITPSFTANLDPKTDTGAADRITNQATVAFTGSGTPGAQITFAEVNAKEPGVTTTADATGAYTASIPLNVGTSTFKVTSVDAFGQTISGSIQPVTYSTGSVPGSLPTTTSTS